MVNCAKTIMQYRDRSVIIRQILEVANGAEAVTKTKIMYKAFLSYKQLNEYLRVLIERDLLSYDSITHTFKVTEKGLRLLRFFNELDDTTNKASQPRSTTIYTQIIGEK